MAECNSHETPNMYPNLNAVSLNDQQQFRLNKINGELMSKRLSKYIASFDYFGKSLIVLSITTGSISIASFANFVGTPVRMMSASCSLACSITTGIVKKLLKTTRNKKKKHNKIVTLSRSKLNSIESKISKALTNNEISHEDFMTVFNEEKNIEN